MSTQTQQTEKHANPLVEISRHIQSDHMTEQLRMALPEHISVEKFQRVVMTAINKNHDLLSGDRQSLFTACVECAQDGLLPDSKEAALVIYSVNIGTKENKNYIKKVQYMPMIKGIYKKAHNSGEVTFLDTHVVFQNDTFDYQLGDSPGLTHKPNIQERGEFIAAYAIARMAGSQQPYIEVMPKSDIDHVRDEASKTAKYGPWKNYYGEMARKTVLRRLSKRLPLSSDLSRVIERVDAMHTFESQHDQNEALPPPPRPKLEDFSREPQMTVELLVLLDEHGEHVGDFAKPDYVTVCVSRIEAFTDPDMLEAFWEYNAETRETLGGRSDEAKAIAGAYNAKRQDLMAGKEAAPTETEPEAEWAEWCAGFKEKLDAAQSVDEVDALFTDNKGHFDSLQPQFPERYQSLINHAEQRKATVHTAE